MWVSNDLLNESQPLSQLIEANSCGIARQVSAIAEVLWGQQEQW